uniref:ABC transporter permease subunit n=1 Tax=Dialister succinatiphilus TaxID=487173 RepID=UPI0040386784
TIGLSRFQTYVQVIIPQAAVIALPNFGNSVINLMKESALAYTIGLIDLLGRTNLIIAKNYGAYGIELYVACLLIYWGLSLVIEQAFLRMESYLDRGRLKA